jgi:Mg-chelatase subunit ChlD
MKRRPTLSLIVLVVATAAVAVAVDLLTRAYDLRWTLGGEEYELLSPGMLLVVAVTPFLVWVVSRSLADLPRIQRYLAVALRTGLIVVLALCLARLARTTETTRVSTIFLVDVSESVPDGALEDARALVQDAWAARGDNDVQLVTFARDARVVGLASGSDEVPTLERHVPPDAEDRSAGAASNLAAALQLAYGLYPPGHLRRAVLVSDGGQTHGDLLAEASRAASFGVRVYYHPYRRGAPAEVAVRDLELPERIEVGEPFHVRARLFASRPADARIRLYQGETLNGLDGVRDVTLEAGDNEIELDSIVRIAGPVTYRLSVEPGGDDRFGANNEFENTVVVPGRPAVLYVEGARGRGSYLAQALTSGDFEVDVRSPRAIPTSLRELERFDFFILSDVSADQVSLTQMDAIERYVRDVGGGFLMAGGEDGFGLGGWQGTRMERLLPVRMDSERRRDQPSLGLALVIDKSGSMNGQKMELAKEAASATAELLGSDDYIEVIGFDSSPERVVRMQSARNRVRILRDIGRLTARGGTSIFPAMDMAYQDLAVTRARIKHVIMLTDGQSPEQGIPELTQAMRAEGITVSTVGLGADVNRALLTSVANLGGGRSYFTSDPHNIPRIFMRETTTVARSSAVEEYFQPTVVERADFLRGIDLASAPFLHGYVATRAKPSPAQVVLESELAEPILARWRVGLGWSMAWTSDVKNRWAVEWLRWPAFSRFWAQLVREHMRQRRRQTLDMRAEVTGDEAHVVVDAIDQADQFLNGLDSTVTLVGPMGAPEPPRRRDGEDAPTHTRDGRRYRERHELPLRQTAPGRYEASFPLERYGSFVLTAEHRREDRVIAESHAQLKNPYPREYMTLEADEALLARAADVTGGGAEPTPDVLFDPQGEEITYHEELWPKLLYLALLLFVLDLLLRRVRLFDRRFRAAPSRRSA